MPPRDFSLASPDSSIAGLLMPPSYAAAAGRLGVSVPCFVSCRSEIYKLTHSSSVSASSGSSISSFSANASSSRHIHANRCRHLDYDWVAGTPNRDGGVRPDLTGQRDHLSTVQCHQRVSIRRHISNFTRTAVEFRAWRRWAQSAHDLARCHCPGRRGLGNG